ncbi:MAG: hypothetical protein PUE89_08840 [Lachnospiraceae bacterium]|nr:hypothetical protein [Lachnospiraceae bacterium]
MKNKTVNKKVLRAMSIGLAAMMTVQPILATPVFADDTEPVDDSNTTTYDEEKHESETTNDAREAVDTASDSANTVVNDVKDIKTDIPVIDQETGKVLNQANLVPEALEKVGDTLKVVDADLTIVENYLTDDNVSKITGSGFDEAYKANVQAYVAAVAVYGEEGPAKPEEGAEDYDAALKAYDDFQALKAEIKRLSSYEYNANNVLKPAIEGVTAEDFVSETEANSNIATAEEKANEAVDGANKAQETANTAGNDAKELIKETETQFDNYVNEIKNAATIDAANESYDKLVDMLNKAETTLEDKQKVYNDAVDAYNKHKKEYDDQKKAIEDAETAYKAAQDIYNEAKKEYYKFSDEHDQKVKDLTIYHNTLADAEAKYKNAVEKLGKIKEQSDKIAAAATAAKASILANGGNSILAAIDVTEKSSSRDWGEQDKLFEEIVKNYYVPEKLEGKLEKLEWTRVSEDMCNYCVVTYTDKKGNEQTLVLDYVMTNDDEDGTLKETTDEKPGKLNGNSTSKIVIFEKSEDERKAADAYKKDKNALLYDDKDINVDKYKVINEKGQTVYLNKSYVDGELAKEDGSIINVGGVYYQKGDTPDVKLTYDENGLVSDTTNEDESERTVITVDKDTVKAEDLILEDGSKFVQEYKGDTTTIVYHKELSQSGYDYDSANAALDDAKKAVGKEDELISAETVSETHKEYTTSGTYIPIFQETITISENVKSWNAGSAILEKGSSVKRGLEDTKTSIEEDGYFILDENWSDITANTNEKDKFGKEENYTVSQTATFTYVSKELVKKGTEKDFVFADLFNFKSSEEAQKAVANKLKSQGKILISWKSFDLNLGKATYTYIDTVQASGETCTSKADAKASFDSKVNVKGRDGATSLGSYTDLRGNKIDLVNSSTDSKDVTKYGYQLLYWDQTSNTTANMLIKTETASKVYGVVVQNQDGDIVLNQVTDKNFNEFIEKVKAQNERFKTLEEDALKAKADVEAAQTKVNELKGAIDKIKETNVKQVNKLKPLVLLDGVDFSNYELKDLEKFLEKAQEQLNDAKARLAKLNEQLEDAEEARDNRITDLTPAPAPAPTTGGGETTPAAGGGTTTAPIPTLATALTGAPTFALPTGGVAAPAAGVAGARTSRGAAIDADSSEAGTEDTTAKIAPTKEVEEDALAITKDTIKTIKDNETPLSSLTEDSTQKMNWWWLLLIALLGATGEEIYRRNKKKKEEEAALKAEVDKNN